MSASVICTFRVSIAPLTCGPYLSRETSRWLKIWLQHAGITEGTAFRGSLGSIKSVGH